MSDPLEQDTPHPLSHDLNGHFDQIGTYPTIGAFLGSDLYARHREEIDRVLDGIAEGRFSRTAPDGRTEVSAVAWNLERGRKLEGLVEVLTQHTRFRSSDVLLLTELDIGMARSGNLDIPREIATRANLNYAFAPSYINLMKGSGLEVEASGDNREALHGNAIFSPHPIQDAHSIVLPNGKDKLRGREKRLGSQRAVVATIDHPAGPFRAVSVHLDAHSSQRHRHRQMKIILDHLEGTEPDLPTLIGGDWNTSTGNSRRAVYSILGFYRRVAMGVGHVLTYHYPYPERYFERALFRTLERRGFDFRNLNVPGGCTLTYDIVDLAQNSGMADWLPQWCFAWIKWALRNHDGKCALKLDWFAGKDLSAVQGGPAVLYDVLRDHGKLSDHDPIAVDFTLQSSGTFAQTTDPNHQQRRTRAQRPPGSARRQ